MKNPFDTPEREEFRAQLKAFVDKEIKPYVNDWDEEGKIPWDLHQKAGALGVWGFGIDEKYGGLGEDDNFLRAIYNEEFAKCGAGGVGAAMGGRMISLEPIQRLCSSEIKDRVLKDIVTGKKGSSLGITEPGGGSDVANMKTSAKRDGNHFVINGSKTFITGAMTSDYFVVGARTGGSGLKGISLFFVEADRDGFSRVPLDKKMGWWCSDQATLYFQVIRHKLANMSSKIDALEALVNNICWNMNNGEVPVAEISKAKFFATKELEYCSSEAMQIMGGAGYLRGNPVERIYREVKVMAIGGGSEEIMRDLAVRQMGY